LERNATNLCRKTAIADGALKRSFLGVTAVMNLECRVAGECLVADVTRCIAPHCTQINPPFNTNSMSLIAKSERTITL
jgi:hypothetical protein